MTLQWQPVPYGRGNAECFADAPPLGRWLIRREISARRNAPPRFGLRLNGNQVATFTSVEDAKAEAERRTPRD